MNEAEALSVSRLTVSYGDKPVLLNVSLRLQTGRLTGIMGPNGAGKSTFIKAVLGVVKPLEGEVSILGKPLKAVRKRISYVPQRESVDWDFPTTVRDVVRMGRYGNLGLFGRFKKHDREIVEEAMQKLDITDLAEKSISALSGGQQQRVFLARALAQEADLYFMDEPFVGIDASTESLITDILRGLAAKGKTIIIVHHDFKTAGEYFDEIILLKRVLIAKGAPEEVLTVQHIEEAYGGKVF